MKKTATLLIASLSACLSFAQVTPVWTSNYNGIGDFSDKWNAMALDAAGNIYLTGSSMVSGNYTDVITAKLNSLGDTAWVRTYNGLNNNNDKGSDIKVDASGNVYVTGTVDNAASGNDIVTIKYSSIGNLLWVNNYDGINQSDNAVALAVDALGNVNVTGNTDTDPSATVITDYITLQYNSAGAQQWVKAYDGAGAGNDVAVGIATDNSNNVYVSGYADGDSSVVINNDYATIKYNSAGVQQWLTVFDGGASDKVAAIKSNAAGDVFVTGRSLNGINDDYYTIAYNTSSTVLWGTAYDGVGAGMDRATALAFDANNNVYVTGQSDGDTTVLINYDYVTLMYDATGVQQWATAYNGSGSNNDVPSDIAVLGAKIYVTGKTDADPSATVSNDYATLQYNATGVQQWVKTYNGSANGSDAANAMKLDASGNCFVTGGSLQNVTQKDGATIKYTSAGVQQWLKIFNGIGDNSDNGNAIAVDASGNAYVAGYTFGNGTDRDICIIKINAAQGDTAWIRKFNGTANSLDQATAIDVDATGNVYVTGYEKDLTSGYDYITFKYNSSGVLQWATAYNGLGNGTDKASDLSIDASGNVYITGYSDSDPSAVTNSDYVTVMYNSAGTQMWVTSYNGTGNGSDRATGIVVDATGNTYVTGFSDIDATAAVNNDYVTVKYNSAGVQQNIINYNGAANLSDQPNAIAIDASSNIYVTGQSSAANLFDNCATIKYNSTLIQQWAQIYNGTANRTDRALSIDLDATGGVYIAGQTATDTSAFVKNYDYITIKYNSSGVQQWAKTYNGQSNTNDVAADIALDANGNVYVTGQSENGTSLLPNKDFVTVKYDNAGNAQQCNAIYNGTANATDGANAIAVRGSYVYVTGASVGTVNPSKDIITFKYKIVSTPTLTKTDACGSATLTSSATAGTYLWTPGGATSQTISVTNSGTYYLKITENGCTSADSVISSPLTIPDVSISVNFDTIKSNQINATYQWINCNSGNVIINGATNRTFVPSQNGNYAVIVNNGACFDTSVCQNIVVTGIKYTNSNLAFVVSVYPNPSQNTVGVSFPKEVLVLELYNNIGQLMIRKDVKESLKQDLDISQLVAGVYQLKFIAVNGCLNKKIVKID